MSTEYKYDKGYTRLMSGTGLSSMSQYTSEQEEAIHAKLLEDALTRLWSSHDYDWTEKLSIDMVDISEHRRDDYKEASVCTFKTKTYPMKQWKVDMSDYWNKNYISDVTDNDALNVNGYVNKDDEIVSVNYVTGKARMRSRLLGLEHDIDLSKVSSYTPMSVDEMSIRDTFTYKINNNR